MTKTERLEAKFEPKSLSHYGDIVLSASDAMEMLQEAQLAGVDLLGIDSFRLYDGGKIQPSMEHSIDYSSLKLAPIAIWSDAIAFVRNKATLGFVFEIVLGEHQESS